MNAMIGAYVSNFTLITYRIPEVKYLEVKITMFWKVYPQQRNINIALTVLINLSFARSSLMRKIFLAVWKSCFGFILSLHPDNILSDSLNHDVMISFRRGTTMDLQLSGQKTLIARPSMVKKSLIAANSIGSFCLVFRKEARIQRIKPRIKRSPVQW